MKRYRLGISIFLFWLMLLPLATVQTHAAEPTTIQLIINGKAYKPDAPPKIVDGRTLVPIRVIAEALGAKVEWNDKQREVKVSNTSIDVSMVIGSRKATVKGKNVMLDTAPTLFNGRTLVPLRFIGDSLGTPVGWEASSRSVIVNQPYIMTVNDQNVEGKIFNINQEYYLPLKELSAHIGVELIKTQKGERLVMDGKEIPLEGEGQKRFKLRKLDTGWVIPQSTLSNEFNLQITTDNRNIRLEKKTDQGKQPVQTNLSELKSVRESQGNVYIDFTLPTTSKHFLMSDPYRIVVDLPNMVLGDQLLAKNSSKEGTTKRSTANATSYVEGQSLLNKPISELGTAIVEEVEEQVIPEDIHEHELVDSEELGLFVKDETKNTENEKLIKDVRYSQFSSDPFTVRVVVELTRKVNYEMLPTESGYVIALKQTPKKEGFLVVIDPGHGGKDPGAKGVTGNLEKDLNLAVGNYLAEELKGYKEFQIMQTRTGDTFPTLQERVQLANDVSADLFLSIHGNSFKPETRGTETYYYTAKSEAFAKILHKHLLKATGFPDRGAKVSGFYVIKNTVMPSALVELGFLTNAVENVQLQNPEFQKGIAKALAKAIHEYYTSL